MGDADKAARRTAILAAAKAVFGERGYHGATMADVATAAGSSYGSVYWYFATKEELFHALMDDEAATLRAAIAAAVPDGHRPEAGTLRQRLVAAVRATFEVFETDRASVTLLFRDAPSLGAGFGRHLDRLFDAFVDELAAWLGPGPAPPLDADGPAPVPARTAAFAIVALVGQLALRRTSTDDGLSAEALASLVVDLVLDGLRPR